MRRIVATIIGMLVVAPVIWARPEDPVTLRSNGWIVTADPDQAVLSVSHESLGTILQQIRLNMRDQHGLQPLKRWSANKQGESQLLIRTSEPRTAWVLELSPDGLRIATTLAEAVLTAEAPATSGRIVARVLDPQGTPVNWALTQENMHTYGGTGTQAINPSFLPRSNPEVMYFALGQVASSNLHTLFDRKTDAVIDFSEQTSMQRHPQNPDLLDITLPVPGNTRIRFVPDYFTKVLGLPYYEPFDDTYFPTAPMVWDNWSTYYEKVREEDIVRNTDWIAANLKAYGYQYVQLDDGYDRGPGGTHYWTEKWSRETFPHGPKWLVDYIKSKGLHPGVWWVPNTSQVPFEQHPDWFLYFKKDWKWAFTDAAKAKNVARDGVVLDYLAPTLDSTNLQVLDFLRKELTILDDWGFEYYKFDGEHDFLKYVPHVDLDRIANKSIDPIEAYRNRLKVIRDTVGPRRFIEACPSGTPLDGIGYFNSYFTGEDPHNNWLGMYTVFSSLNANAFLNHLAVYVMPGEMDVEPRMSLEEAKKKRPGPAEEITGELGSPSLEGFGETLAEARTVVSHVALSGTEYSLGSLVAELPPERTRLLQMTLPTTPILPIDLFSRGTDLPVWGDPPGHLNRRLHPQLPRDSRPEGQCSRRRI